MTKTIIIAVCSVLSLYAYVPYIRLIWRGTVKPHFYTWCVGTVISAIAIPLMIIGGGGIGVLPTAIGGISCGIVAISSYRYRGHATKSDFAFIGMALIAIPVWLLMDDPMYSSLLVSGIMFITFMPTVRKAWHKPHEESTRQYLISSIRFGVSIAGLKAFTITTMAFSISLTTVNALVVGAILLGKMRTN